MAHRPDGPERILLKLKALWADRSEVLPSSRWLVPSALRKTFIDPDVNSYLLDIEGERLLAEVRRHWAAYWRAVLELVLAVILLVVPTGGSSGAGRILVIIVLALFLHGALLWSRQHVDRFVITDLRVFRVYGVLNRRVSTMPLSRVQDISFERPLIGRLVGFGHFELESAAQEQPLRSIRYVGWPDERDQLIQRVVYLSGVRASIRRSVTRQ
jgi:membrane protein YdbS with pleckstrin-like domain